MNYLDISAYQGFDDMSHFNAIIFSFLALAIVAAFLRLYSRCLLNKNSGIDDALTTIALLLTAWQTAERHLQTLHVRAVYDWMVATYTTEQDPYNDMLNWPPEMRQHFQWAWRHGLLYSVAQGSALGFIKCSILCFYLRFVFDTRPRRVIYGTLAFIVILTLWWILMRCTGFRPVEAVWNFIDHPEMAPVLSITAQEVVFGAGHVALDIAILYFPVPTMISLHLPSLKKIGIGFIYATGLASLTATILSLYASVKFDRVYTEWSKILLYHSIVSFWANTEICTAVICASMPAISNLFSTCVGRYKRTPKVSTQHRIWVHRGGNNISLRPMSLNVWSFVRTSRRSRTPLDASRLPTYAPQLPSLPTEIQADVRAAEWSGKESGTSAGTLRP